jgi:phosphate transport system substrate-binding protein
MRTWGLLFLCACAQPTRALLIDGSSTAFALAEASARRFAAEHPQIEIAVGNAGSGSAFAKLCRHEIDIAFASREPEPFEVCAPLQGFPLAKDAILVVVHESSTFADNMTLAELRRVWEPRDPPNLWQQIRPTWPAKRFFLYGPTPGSGTFALLTHALSLPPRATRPDFATGEDYQRLVRAMANDEQTLAIVGRAFFRSAPTHLRVVPIIDAVDTMTRTLRMYVSEETLERKEARAFVDATTAWAATLAPSLGLEALP